MTSIVNSLVTSTEIYYSIIVSFKSSMWKRKRLKLNLDNRKKRCWAFEAASVVVPLKIIQQLIQSGWSVGLQLSGQDSGIATRFGTSSMWNGFPTCSFPWRRVGNGTQLWWLGLQVSFLKQQKLSCVNCPINIEKKFNLVLEKRFQIRS